MATFNEKFNYFEDDTLASDWFNSMCNNIAWKAFQDQEKWAWMIGELGNDENGKPLKPKVKPNAIEFFNTLFNDEMAFMRECVVYGFMKMYNEDDIDLSEEIEDDLKDFYGFDEDE